MPRKLLTTNEQLEKLNSVEALARKAASSQDLISKLGAVVLYAGLAEFMVVQFARLFEQIILKAQVVEGQKPKFRPRPDSWFYDSRVDTRRILKIVKAQILPLRAGSLGSAADAERVNNLANDFISAAEKFLNYRNAIVHHLGSPKTTLEDVRVLCGKALGAYTNFQCVQTAFFNAAQPYRFGGKELQYFYDTDERLSQTNSYSAPE